MSRTFRLQLEPEIVVMAVALVAVAGAGTAMLGWQGDTGTIDPFSALFDSNPGGEVPEQDPPHLRLSEAVPRSPANLPFQAGTFRPSFINAFEVDPGASNAPFGDARCLMEI